MLAIAATTVAGSLLVTLALSFIQTGMATDQQLDLMLRFAILAASMPGACCRNW